MKNWIIISTLTSVLLGCKEEFVPAHRITLNTNKIVLMGKAESGTAVRFATNAEKWWTQADAEWIYAEPATGGKGTTRVMIRSRAENNSDTSRTGHITFFTDQISATPQVIQHPTDAILITPNVFELDWRDTTIHFSVRVKENIRIGNLHPRPALWQYEDPWIKFFGLGALSEENTWHVSENPSTVPRQKYILWSEPIDFDQTVYGPSLNYGAYAAMTIKQAGRPANAE